MEYWSNFLFLQFSNFRNRKTFDYCICFIIKSYYSNFKHDLLTFLIQFVFASVTGFKIFINQNTPPCNHTCTLYFLGYQICPPYVHRFKPCSTFSIWPSCRLDWFQCWSAANQPLPLPALYHLAGKGQPLCRTLWVICKGAQETWWGPKALQRKIRNC